MKYLHEKLVRSLPKQVKKREKTTGTTVQQQLARLVNSYWHNPSTVAGIILQQSLARSETVRKI